MCLITSIGVHEFRPYNKKKGVYLVDACICVWMENATSSRCAGIPIGLVFVDLFGKMNFQSSVGSLL